MVIIKSFESFSKSIYKQLKKKPSLQIQVHQLGDDTSSECTKICINHSQERSGIRVMDFREIDLSPIKFRSATNVKRTAQCARNGLKILLLACPVFWPTPQIQSFFSFLGAP
jgi:hypothetical protein